MRVILALILCAAFVWSNEAAADKKDKAEDLVIDAEQTINDFKSDEQMAWFRNNVQNAKALLIVPESIKGGFILGGSGGNGVLLARNAGSGSWSYPAFYTLGSVTFGLQFGGEVAQIVLMIMTDRGVDALLTSDVKIGADISVAAGPVGAGAKAQTADVLAFSKAKGLYGGINLEGAVVDVRDSWNEAYYDKDDVSPRDILITRSVSNPQANDLRRALRDLPQN